MKGYNMGSQVKMLITDLDGTLLRDDKTVSQRNRLALARCRESGIKVVFATGRGLLNDVVPLAWFDGHAVSNGAYAFAGEKAVYQRLLDDETIRWVTEACGRRGIAAVSRTKGQISLPGVKPADLDYVSSILPDGLYVIVLREGFGQIMREEARKHMAMEALARHWGINQSETVAFGDDVNDRGMLDWAGIGVAMENALDDIKAVADEVCPGNEDDGIAAWIEANIFAR